MDPAIELFQVRLPRKTMSRTTLSTGILARDRSSVNAHIDIANFSASERTMEVVLFDWGVDQLWEEPTPIPVTPAGSITVAPKSLRSFLALITQSTAQPAQQLAHYEVRVTVSDIEDVVVNCFALDGDGNVIAGNTVMHAGLVKIQTDTWVVAPDGAEGANIAGTLDEPWSFAYAGTGADGRIKPADTVWLRGGTYRAEQGFTISFDGARCKPVTWRAAPNESFTLDGAIPAFVDTPQTAWEPFSPSNNVYRSTASYPRSNQYGGFIEIDGQWLPLATHKDKDANNKFTLDWINSDHDNWRHPEPYYLGPGICNDRTDAGPLYVRLDNSLPEAQCNRDVAQIENPDPRHHSLRISRADTYGLTVRGSHHVFEDFTDVHNYYGVFNIADARSDLTFRRVGGRVTLIGARLGRARRVLIEDPSFDGCMDPEKWWVAWEDIKGGSQAADHVRKAGLVYGRAHDVEVTGGYFHDFFDSATSDDSHDVEVHGVEFRSWDDAWQMTGSVYRIDMHHNVFLGAGPSRDRSGTVSVNSDPGTIWIHDNIIDTSRYRIFWFRYGRTDGFSMEIGWREPIPLSRHGVVSGERHTIPWKLYHNTIVAGIDGNAPFASPYVGVDLFGDDQAIADAPHEVYNNIILVRDGRPLGRDTWLNKNARGEIREIYDGNVYWGWSNPPPTDYSEYTSLWVFLHRSEGLVCGSEGLVCGEDPKGSIGDVDKLRNLALAHSRVYYPPGWEAAGLSVDPQLDAAYKPLNAAVASGAVNLTAKGWPGTRPYKPWRGAVQP
jgi:hypothetical protein